jgi:hypothetical protein
MTNIDRRVRRYFALIARVVTFGLIVASIASNRMYWHISRHDQSIEEAAVSDAYWIGGVLAAVLAITAGISTAIACRRYGGTVIDVLLVVVSVCALASSLAIQ